METVLTWRKVGGPGGMLVAAVVALILVAYPAGLIETLGYESKHKRYGGGFTSDESGFSLGLNYFYFMAGQEFFAEYEADIDAGAFVIRVMKGWGEIGNKPHFRHRVTADKKGRVRFPIRESGLYAIDFDGSVLGASRSGKGYDVTYSVRWGVR
jgi:hypothetical protein